MIHAHTWAPHHRKLPYTKTNHWSSSSVMSTQNGSGSLGFLDRNFISLAWKLKDSNPGPTACKACALLLSHSLPQFAIQAHVYLRGNLFSFLEWLDDTQPPRWEYHLATSHITVHDVFLQEDNHISYAMLHIWKDIQTTGSAVEWGSKASSNRVFSNTKIPQTLCKSCTQGNK